MINNFDMEAVRSHWTQQAIEHGLSSSASWSDHSVIEILLELGHITQEQAKRHPARGQISKFIGMPGKAIPDIKKIIKAALE